MTTVYDYVAIKNPQGAKQICEAFGYRVTNSRDMSQNLKTLVNNEGEEAIKMIMDFHPDKEIILDYFGTPKTEQKTTSCGCPTKDNTARTIEQFLNVNGRQENSEARALATNTNTIIFASALVLAVAIIFKNDK